MLFSETKEFIFDKLKNELPQYLSYHSVNHIRDVYSACEIIAAQEGVVGEDLLLLLTAAMYHDSGFLVQQYGHEQKSCDIVRQYLPEFQYSPSQIDRICGMIMATKIPQTPHNLLEEILCDADLDYLGREDFFTIGNFLFSELHVCGAINTEREWNEMQFQFMSKHHYFTNASIKMRKEEKELHLTKIKALLFAPENGVNS